MDTSHEPTVPLSFADVECRAMAHPSVQEIGKQVLIVADLKRKFKEANTGESAVLAYEAWLSAHRHLRMMEQSL